LSWAHHSDSSTVPDALLQAASADQVPSQTMLPHSCLVFLFWELPNLSFGCAVQISFTFTCQIDGKLTPIDSFPRTSALYTTPSLTAKAFAPRVTRELRAPKTPLNSCTTGFIKLSSNASEAVTPPAKTTLRGFPPSSRKSPATVLPRTPKAAPPKKRPKITITHKASKLMAASKHSSDESSASDYVSDDDDDDDDDKDEDDDDDFA
jgi:hypothetical protein